MDETADPVGGVQSRFVEIQHLELPVEKPGAMTENTRVSSHIKSLLNRIGDNND